MSQPQRRLGPVDLYARHRQQHRRTIDNYLHHGYIKGYRMPGVRALLIDFDEADAALAALPPTKVRANYGSRGNAEIVQLPARAVVVEQ